MSTTAALTAESSPDVSFDLKLTDSWDLEFDSTGDLVFTTTRFQSVKQRILITLKTWTGEWFLNTVFGVPYLSKIFNGAARTKKDVDSIFLSELNSVLESDETLVSYKSTFNKTTRVYTMSFIINVADENIQIDYATGSDSTWKYPTPDDSNYTARCDQTTFATDPLYEYLVIDADGLTGTGDWTNDWMKPI